MNLSFRGRQRYCNAKAVNVNIAYWCVQPTSLRILQTYMHIPLYLRLIVPVDTATRTIQAHLNKFAALNTNDRLGDIVFRYEAEFPPLPMHRLVKLE